MVPGSCSNQLRLTLKRVSSSAKRERRPSRKRRGTRVGASFGTGSSLAPRDQRSVETTCTPMKGMRERVSDRAVRRAEQIKGARWGREGAIREGFESRDQRSLLSFIHWFPPK